LRYFYLRGCIYVGCNDLQLAVRSFWTCLSIPSEIVSAIAISAWKKLVLVQALTNVADTATTASSSSTSSTFYNTKGALGSAFAVPKAMPSCINRFLNSAFEQNQTGTSSSVTGSSGREQPESPYRPPPEEEEAMMHVVESMEGESALLPPQAQQGPQPQGVSAALFPFLGVKVYRDLVKAYMDADRNLFTELLQQHQQFFFQDGNWGLVQQVQTSLAKRQVYLFSRMYSVLSLDLLSQYVGMDAHALQLVLLELASERSWAIQVQDGAVVQFPKLAAYTMLPNQQDAATPFELMQLVQMVQELDVTVASSTRYCALNGPCEYWWQ
jgi:hypothetical protein